MTDKIQKRRNKDYNPLKQALTEHIKTIPFDKVFFVDDLYPIAEKLSFSSTELSYGISAISRLGLIERVGHHKKDYRTILHLRRCRNPIPRAEIAAKKVADYQREIEERAQRANEAALRLWKALGMPIAHQRIGANEAFA